MNRKIVLLKNSNFSDDSNTRIIIELKSKCMFIPFCLIVFLISGCLKQPDRNKEINEIEKVINNSIGWFKDKDFDLLYSTMTNSSDLFMYQLDTKSTITSFDEFKKYSVGWQNPKVRYAGHKFIDLKITLSKSGDCAWFHTKLEDCASVNDRPARCFTTRYTGVLEKRDGHWLIVEQHFSLAADEIASDWAQKTAHAPSAD
jgi:ketosteroid isomerase-like protein